MTPSSDAPGAARGRKRYLILAGLAVFGGVGAVAAYNMRRPAEGAGGGAEGASGGVAPAGRVKWTVRRQNLTISSLSSGELKTKTSVSVSNQVDRTLKVTWLIEEGKQVHKGDKLVEFDAADLTEQLLRQRIRMAEVNQAYGKSLDDLAIGESKAATDLVSAANAAKIAAIDLKKYKEGDYLQIKRKMEAAGVLAEEKLRRAQDRLQWTRKLADKGYVTQTELQGDEFSVKSVEIELQTAQQDLKLLEQFTHDREIAQLDTKLVEANGRLDQTKMTNEREIATRKAAVDAAKATMELEQIKLTDLDTQVQRCVVMAPQDGMVVYTSERNRGQESALQIGASINPRQRIIELPDFSSWKIEARVHESRIQQIRTGQRAFATLDAFPETLLAGEVTRISVLPDKSNWWSTSQDYVVDIALTERNPNFKPGMSAKAEIILGEIADALVVPIQAIHSREGKSVVWVAGETGAVPVEVGVGRNNDRFVEIASGLTEGQAVYIDEPVAPSSGVGARPSTRATTDERRAAGDAASQAEKNPAPETGAKKRKKPAAAEGSEGADAAGGMPEEGEKSGKADKAEKVEKKEADAAPAPADAAPKKPAGEAKTLQKGERPSLGQ